MSTAPTIEELQKVIEDQQRQIDDLKVAYVHLHDRIEAGKREADNVEAELRLLVDNLAAKDSPKLLHTLCDIDGIIGRPDLTAPERITAAPKFDILRLVTRKTSN